MTTLTNDQITAGAAVLDLDNLEALARAATPQNLDSAEDSTAPTGFIECPECGGDGSVELTADYCNYDGKAMGVQFYGIGPEHRAAEAFFRAANPAAVLQLIALARRAPFPQVADIAELSSIDTPKFQEVVEAWRSQPYGTGEFLTAWDALVAHIDGKIRDAIAASRRATVGDVAFWFDPHSTVVDQRVFSLTVTKEKFGKYSAPLYATTAPASARQATSESDLRDAAEALLEVLDGYHDQLVPINRKSVTVNWLRRVLAAQPAEGSAGQAGQVAKPALIQALETGDDRENNKWFDIQPSEAQFYKDEGYRVRMLYERAAAPAEPDGQSSGCRMTGGICACRSGGSFGGCARERGDCCTNEPARP